MTIDECILDCIHYTSTDLCKYDGINWSKSQTEQIEEWLEELKSYRAHIFSGDMTRTMLKEQYNKAIDDFAKWLVEHKIVDEDSMPEIIIDFNEEQLKAGEQND